jgi:LEA14-like dessication related protein
MLLFIMKKALLVLLVLAAGAGPVMAFSFPMPTATLTRFDVEAISLRDVSFLFELTVQNPYPVQISFSGMNLAFKVEGTQVFNAESRGGFSVPGNGTKSNLFTVKLAYEDIIKVVKDYVSKDMLNTVIDGTLVIPLPKLPGLPGTYSFSYSVQKKIPAIKPRIALLDFSVQPPTREQVKDALVKAGSSVDAGKALGVLQNVLQGRKPAAPVIDPSSIDVPLTVSFTIQLANEARAELAFPKLGYQLSVNGEKLVTGESTKITRQAGKTLITIGNTFSSRSLSKNIREVFSSRSGTFQLHGTASVKLPDEIRKEPLPLDFDEGGHFSMK